jgi:formylglycine-generating enzyme required for sulfatase activity
VAFACALMALPQARADKRGSEPNLNLPSLRLAIEDLITTHGDAYAKGKEYLARLSEIEQQAKAGVDAALVEKTDALRWEALLANPAIDFDRLLVIRRDATNPKTNFGLPQNWQGNNSIDGRVESELMSMSIRDLKAPLVSIYKPQKPQFVGDVDLHFDGKKLLYSSLGTQNRWHVFEMNIDGSGQRQITSKDYNDVDSYDPMYLPDGRIIYVSTSGYHGVPCVSGSDYVGNLHLMNADGSGVRRLCFDQDLNWNPVMLADGRVMFLRWEYTDSAHYFSRVMMHMNPDGTGQMEYYGSNSYWPNSMFYARPLPNSPTKFIAVVSGHHGVKRMGELVVFDVSRGRQEAAGAVQKIPGYGKPVEPVIKDQLVNSSWPKFLHPYPISDKHFLVTAKLNNESPWGIYLVDIFDNMILLKAEPGSALFEPVPIKAREKPPVIADKVNLSKKTAAAYIHDIYTPGGSLDGVPRGTVKSLRVYQYEYSYRNTGGHYVIGIEGPWDVRRIIGTVPVFDDGSAVFEIPANTPVAIQPLDAEGKALQLMRTWFVGMPGETVSCVGCHERQSSTSALKAAKAARYTPIVPTPWHGPKRGFSYLREVQPVLDKHCVGCHDGKEADRPNFADLTLMSIKGFQSQFPRSYVDLHPYVRRNGPEGDYTGLTPLEFHADTSLLVQILKRGHYNVKLDAEAWDRLITWIDLNVPCHGTWNEATKIRENFPQRRRELATAYANIDDDIEAIAPLPARSVFIKPPAEAARPKPMKTSGWPIDKEKAQKMQADLKDTQFTVDLGKGGKLTMARIPAGEFVMGDPQGYRDEFPQSKVRIAKPYWMATTEITLAQYQQFDSAHRNGYYDMHYKDQVRPGYLMDDPNMPVIRVSQEQAMAFCRWLSEKSGKKFTLPTEAQWEWAARAGSDTPFYWGDLNADFGNYANLSDATVVKMAVSGVDPQPINGEKFGPDFKYWDYELKDARYNDNALHLSTVGRYLPNAWGLHDMIGNVSEWTRSPYRPYPYAEAADAKPAGDVRYVVRGGSWQQRPKDSRVTWRWGYAPWHRVFNTGIRVICED